MAQQRETTTNRLVGIIAGIKMERRSGQLIVRRGEGLAEEEGRLIFVQGQIMQASVGRRNGAEALNWLSTWRQARYIFLPANARADEALPFLSLSSSSPEKVTNPNLRIAQIDTDRLERLYPLAYGIPYPTIESDKAMQRIAQAGLSRAHRRLYLLIDGRRSAVDLVPLSGRKAEEVRKMLHDLEWLGVIRVSNPPVADF
jgi:hypothetical protein